MGSYLYLYGLLVLVLLGAGIYYTVHEFGEMSSHTEDYRKQSNPKISLK